MENTIDSSVLERHLKKTTIISNVVGFLIAMVTSLSFIYGFYYQTTDTVEQHTIQINEVKSDIKELTTAVNNTAVFQGASKEQIKALQEKIEGVQHTQDRIEDKIDKLIIKSN